MSSSPNETPTVVIAGNVPREQIATMEARFPDLSFVHLPSRGARPEEARHAEILLTAGLTSEALSAMITDLPKLRWIQSASSGLDRLLVPGLSERQLHLTRTASARVSPMAEYVVGMTLALVKRVPELLESQHSRHWQRPPATGLTGSSIGIIGAGAVGCAAARRFRPFETRLLGIKRKPVPLPEFDEVWDPTRVGDLLRTADVVVLACPLTDETRHMLGREQFALMKPSAILINVARGQVVVEEELIAALEAGRIGGAALDVFEQEPLPASSPLWSLPNVIVTPHCSSAAPEVWSAVTEEFLVNLKRFLEGAPLANELGPFDLGY